VSSHRLHEVLCSKRHRVRFWSILLVTGLAALQLAIPAEARLVALYCFWILFDSVVVEERIAQY